MSRKTAIALAVALVAALILSSVAYAITIVVDGNREALWNGNGVQTPGTASDPNEPNINDNVDIMTFQWTNDQTNMYFLISTWAPPLMPNLAPVDICLNTDNSASTNIPATNTIQRNRCSYGTGVNGIDTVAEGFRQNNVLFLNVYNVTTDPPTLKGTGVLGYAPVTNPTAPNPVVEMSVPLSLLGFGPGNCPATIPTVVYYDGGDTNPDDNLPDTGAININCGTPTAVTLNSLHAQPTTPPIVPAALIGVSAVALIGVVLFARRRKSA